MKIIITGATGFVGSALSHFLGKNGQHELTCLNSKNCNLLKANSLDAFSSDSYDVIIHLAAWTQAGDFCLRHPGEQWINNQCINTHVLEWWHRAQPQAKLVFMGTSCAYAPGGNLTEDTYMAGEPIDSLYTYAMTKRMLFQGARALHAQYGLRWLCAVPSTLYGPNYHTDGRQLHFIFDLIRKILRGRDLNEPVVLWGDGWQKRELVYIEDFVNILWRLVSSVDNDIVNIGAGEEYTIRTFAGLLCDIIGYDQSKIVYDESKYTGAKSKCLSVEKAKKLLEDDYDMTPLSKGLQQAVAWFEENKLHLAN